MIRYSAIDNHVVGFVMSVTAYDFCYCRRVVAVVTYYPPLLEKLSGSWPPDRLPPSARLYL